MARRQCDQRSTFAGEGWAAADHERASAGLDNSCEGTIEFAFILGFHGHNFPPDDVTRLLHFAQFVDRCRKIGIDQYRNDASPGDQLKQHLHALRAEPVAEER